MNFEFDQLGVEIFPGVFAGSFDGRAEIVFEEFPGDFYVASVELDGLIEGGHRKPILLHVPENLSYVAPLYTFHQHVAARIARSLMEEYEADIIAQGWEDGAHQWPKPGMDEHRLTAKQLGISQVAL